MDCWGFCVIIMRTVGSPREHANATLHWMWTSTSSSASWRSHSHVCFLLQTFNRLWNIHFQAFISWQALSVLANLIMWTRRPFDIIIMHTIEYLHFKKNHDITQIHDTQCVWLSLFSCGDDSHCLSRPLVMTGSLKSCWFTQLGCHKPFLGKLVGLRDTLHFVSCPW